MRAYRETLAASTSAAPRRADALLLRDRHEALVEIGQQEIPVVGGGRDPRQNPGEPRSFGTHRAVPSATDPPKPSQSRSKRTRERVIAASPAGRTR